jgi:C4-dicarboxylate-specific signal transduction histidine kinase
VPASNGLRYLEVRLMPERSATGKVEFVLALTRDVTEQKKAEADRQKLETQLRQSQKMEAIGQLAGGVAHDFNNLLTVIQGNASLLLNPQLNAGERSGCSHQIVQAAERAASLTRHTNSRRPSGTAWIGNRQRRERLSRWFRPAFTRHK